MGYAAEKKQVEKKKKKLLWIILGCVVVLIVGLVIFSSQYPIDTWKYYFSLPSVSERKAGELRIHFLDVGQGDCTLLELPDGKTMMIDGGNGSKANVGRVMRYLNALDIQTIDYLLLTHADGDHAGGLDSVLEYKTVKTVYYPNLEDPAVNQDYASFYSALLDEECKKVRSERYLTISSTKEKYPFTLTFLYPYSKESGAEAETENDGSAIVWLDYQGVSAIFCGDASSEVERRLITEDSLGLFGDVGVTLQNTEILKVAHHGSADSTCEEFVEYLGVKTAIVSVGKGNEYGHPSAEVQQTLSKAGAEILRTDESGNIMLTIKDGNYKAKIVK
ncbi:MAG: MBL fold metallo-hydrolase [Clostridia bacterium]|nr:MBL fold metallo-hydrolase [Clostridia bacterium]